MKYPLKISVIGTAFAISYLACVNTNASEAPSSKITAIATARAELSAIDRKFISLTGLSGATELTASKLALAQSSNMRVQFFAHLLISDHEKMIRQFNDVTLRIGRHASVYSPDLAIVNKLKKLKQTEFDHIYIGTVAVAGQQQAIDLFELEAKQGRNDELRWFAERMLPVIKHHFKMGEELIREVQDDPDGPPDHGEPSVTLVSWTDRSGSSDSSAIGVSHRLTYVWKKHLDIRTVSFDTSTNVE